MQIILSSRPYIIHRSFYLIFLYIHNIKGTGRAMINNNIISNTWIKFWRKGVWIKGWRIMMGDEEIFTL